MKYMRRHSRFTTHNEPLEDPIAGVANLFDASVVFIVSMMIALFMAYNMMDLLDPKSEVTMTKKTADGKIEMVSKKGKEIKVTKVSDKELAGSGQRLGTAFQLDNGKVVYVPEE